MDANVILTRRCRLRPVLAGDVDHVARVLEDSPGWRGSAGLIMPNIDAWSVMSDSVAAQAAIISREELSVVGGIVQIVGWNLRTSAAELSVGMPAKFWQRIWPIEGVLAFIEWAFKEFEVDSLRISIPAEIEHRHGLKVEKWADAEGETAFGGNWRLDAEAWRKLGIPRLIGMV